MFKNSKILFAGVLGLFATFVMFTFAQAVNTTVNLSVTAGTVTPASTGTFSFGAFAVAGTQTVTGKQFTGTDYFSVTDLKGAFSGWYTTIQVSDLTGTAGTISSGNIALKVVSTGAVLITGTANSNVVVGATSGTLLNYNAINTAITFLKRDPATNSGKVGVYAAFPWLQVTIPAYQAVGSYQAILTYTLIEN